MKELRIAKAGALLRGASAPTQQKSRGLSSPRGDQRIPPPPGAGDEGARMELAVDLPAANMLDAAGYIVYDGKPPANWLDLARELTLCGRQHTPIWAVWSEYRPVTCIWEFALAGDRPVIVRHAYGERIEYKSPTWSNVMPSTTPVRPGEGRWFLVLANRAEFHILRAGQQLEHTGIVTSVSPNWWNAVRDRVLNYIPF